LQIKQLSLDRISSTSIFWKIGLTISILFGFLIRINGIGNTPLAVDEYYFVKAVENILKHGLPEYDSGGYYTRGVLFQYILAFVSLIWHTKVEFSYRLLTILFNFLAFPVVFKLSRKIAGETIAYIVTILFCFSLWEIEFSRFIRMYSLFQTVFLWYIYFLYLIIVKDKSQYFKWTYLLSLLGIFIYEGGVFLIVLNFLPFILKPERLKKSHFLICLFLLILDVVYVSIDFRHIGVQNYLPPDVNIVSESIGPILLPIMLIQALPSNGIWFIPFLLPLGFSGFIVYRLFKDEKIDRTTKLSLTLLILLSLLNLYGLLIGLFVLFVLFRWVSGKDFTWKKIVGSLSAMALNLVFWFIYVFSSGSGMTFFKNTKISPLRYSVLSQLQLHDPNQLSTDFSVKKVIFLFFNYPHFYDIIVEQFLEAVPIYFALSVLFMIGYFMFFFIEKYKNKSEKFGGESFVISIVLLMVLGVTSLNVPYNTTRYSFFFYPLIILMVVHSMYKLSHRVFSRKEMALPFFGIMVIGFIAVTEDYDFNHLAHTGSKEIYLRMNFNDDLAAHYYSRDDASSPAEFVNSHLKADDIVITTVIQTEHYLKKLDYFYLDYNSKRLFLLSIENGTRELWTNANLLYHENDLIEVIKKSSRDVWMIVKVPEKHDDSIEAKIATIYQKDLFYKSFDKRINVYRIQKNSIGNPIHD
jgi:hypothetical protein